MLKILIKKQMQEVGAFLYQDRKKGTRRSGKNLIAYLLLLAVLYLMFGGIFFQVSQWMCGSFLAVGLGWLYYALMGMISIVLGVFGSVFNTYASLYMAKDNEMLLSLPVKPRDILLARLVGVYIMGLFYEALVMVPAILVYMINAGWDLKALLCGLLLMFVLSFFVLMLSCLLGWGVALISSHLKHKSYITVVLSLAFLTAYYYVYFKASSYLQLMLENAVMVGNVVKSKGAPVYYMGLAGTGDVLSLLIVAVLTAALLGLTYVIMMRSFEKIMMTNKGEKKAVYKEKEMKAETAGNALFRKEMKRFTGSATYMLNCGLGALMLLLVPVMLLWKSAELEKMIAVMELGDSVVLLLAAALCSVTAMNDITAPSISLEGKNLWILQSLPVSAWEIFRAKLKLHLLLTFVPLVVCMAGVCYVIPLELPAIAVLIGVLISFVLFTALFGLALGLKMPLLSWTNETVPVKQAGNVMIALFGSWAVIVVFGGIYFLLDQWLGPAAYLLFCMAVLLAVDAGLVFWLKGTGSRIFENL